jgi:hypothetical protein
MSDRIQIQITATENASRAFTQVASSADRMDQSLDKAERTSQRFSRSGAAIGAMLGTVGGLLSDAARAAAEAEVSQERLRAAIEATGDTYEEYASQLEAAGEAAVAMGFDDEAALDSIARLTTATGDAGAAIENLGLIMDIARGRGIALSEATRIVEAVETGRMSVLRRLGIVLDENMSKEEALAELQRRYAGQAEAYAETTAGAMDRLREQIENVQEAVGEHAGGLQSLLIVLPGLSAGYTALAAGVGAFSRAMVGSNTGALAAARALGPLGILGALTALAVAYDQFGRENRMDEIWSDFEEGADRLDAVLADFAAHGEKELLSLGDASNVLVDGMIADFERFGELADLIDMGEATAAQRAEFEALSEVFRGMTADVEDFSQVESSLASILANTGEGAGLVRDQLDQLNQGLEDGLITAEQWMVGVNNLAGAFETYDRAATNGLGTQELLNNQLQITAENFNILSVEAARAAAAMSPGEVSAFLNAQAIKEAADAAKEYADAVVAAQEELARVFALTRSEYTATGEALDNVFRVIVGNTNAIAQQSQAVADWATELIAVEGTYSALDDLLTNNSITLQQYTDAQRAHNTIQADNAMIQNDILSIQAQSAPVLASLMASQARYVNELANAEAPAQALALAYMDTATSARALELAQIAASEAPGFEGLIQGAIAANPYIEAILTDMGVVSRGAQGQLIINTEGETELEALTNAINALTDVFVAVVIDVDDSELAEFDQWLQESGLPGGGGIAGGGGLTMSVRVIAETADADAKIDATSGKLTEWDGASATGDILADATDADNKIASAEGNLAGWDASSGTAQIEAADNASGKISSVISLLNSVPRSVTTTLTTNVVTNYITTGTPAFSPFAHGGVVDSYASGGVIAQMAENGPEMLHFPNGGVAIAPTPGMYTVPQGTYVDTAPATAAKLSGMGGGFTLVNNGTIIGVPDLERQITRTISEGLRRANAIHRSSFA